jgi:competence ComEA-like helix-hairpin-helix protein
MARHNVATLAMSTGALVFAVVLTARHQDAKDPEDARSEAVLARVCTDCHEWQRIGETRRTKDQWEDLISDMMDRAGGASDKDYNAILEYALRHYGFVNVNKAPADEISLVIGLTSKEAEAILSYRTAHGKFEDFEALKKVVGVDPKMLDAARQWILY